MRPYQGASTATATTAKSRAAAQRGPGRGVGTRPRSTISPIAPTKNRPRYLVSAAVAAKTAASTSHRRSPEPRQRLTAESAAVTKRVSPAST